MVNIKAQRDAALTSIRQYLDELQVNEVLFALPKPGVPGGYANPYVRLTFVGPNGWLRMKTTLNGRVVDYTLTAGKLLCCLSLSCVERLDLSPEPMISIVFLERCIRFVYKPAGCADTFYWYHTRRPLSVGGGLLLRSLLSFARENRPQTLLAGTVHDLLRVVLDDLDHDLEGGSKAVRTYQQALYLILSQFQSDISRESIAAQLGITPQHLSRLFKNTGAGAFSDLLTQIRLEYAIELMHDSQLPLDEVANRAGFHSCSYFIKVFKKQMGITPARFRS